MERTKAPRAPGPETFIRSIVAQHSGEAAWSWCLRDTVVRRPHYDLRSLAALDERVEAHLDGLRLAEDSGWEICKTQLADADVAGAVFTTAALAFAGAADDRIRLVLDTGTATPESTRELVAALAWAPYAQVADQLGRLTRAGDPVRRRVAIAAYAAHRHDPGATLARALSADDAPLRARALRAAGELGRTDLLRTVRARLDDESEKCRVAAASSTVLLGDRSAAPALQALAESAEPSGIAATLGARALTVGAGGEWVRSLVHDARTLRLGIVAAGHVGNPVAVPWLLEQMAVPEHARVAGEAFSFITGVDLAHASLDAKQPQGFQSGPTDDPQDENVAMDADEDLPWPDVEKVAAWWSQNRTMFRPGTRHLLGKPITPASIVDALKTGGQRQRAAAALELALASAGRHLFEVRAPGHRQQQALGVRRG
jgi:uncharacterized protein (TIGR02270 family)